MDKNVPAGAALLLDFIGVTETGRDGPGGYDVIYAHKQGKLPKPLTSMTLDEVQAAQRLWSKHHGSSAAGRYQFMRATLKGLIAELGLRGSQHFDANLQDRLGYHLLKRRGYLDFAAGRIGLTEFGKRLAQEWASFPVLERTKGAHRTVEAGETYYAGDKLNKALIAPQQVSAALNRVVAINEQAETPTSRPSPLPTPTDPVAAPQPQPAGKARRVNWLAVLAFAAFVAAVVWFVFFRPI